MTDRLPLKALWPALRRSSGQVQFGLDPDRSVVVDGLTGPEAAALARLDGHRGLPEALTTPESSDLLALLREHRLVAGPDPGGGLPPRTRALLAADADAATRTQPGLAGGYAVLGRRCGRPVLVVGRGSLPAALTTVLRRAGAAAACAPEGAVEAGGAGGPLGTDGRWPSRPDPTALTADDLALVVLTGLHALDPAAGEPWRRHGIPLLPVVLHATEVVVGPVLSPPGPCLRCLDHTRADLDPAWPTMLGQLAPPAVGAGPDVSGETTLVWLGASMAAMAALAVVDRVPFPAGRSVEVGLPWPGVRQRQWRAHPRCRCGSADANGRPSDEHRPDQDRMAG